VDGELNTTAAAKEPPAIAQGRGFSFSPRRQPKRRLLQGVPQKLITG
jgi:hypothetical protein